MSYCYVVAILKRHLFDRPLTMYQDKNGALHFFSIFLLCLKLTWCRRFLWDCPGGTHTRTGLQFFTVPMWRAELTFAVLGLCTHPDDVSDGCFHSAVKSALLLVAVFLRHVIVDAVHEHVPFPETRGCRDGKLFTDVAARYRRLQHYLRYYNENYRLGTKLWENIYSEVCDGEKVSYETFARVSIIYNSSQKCNRTCFIAFAMQILWSICRSKHYRYI